MRTELSPKLRELHGRHGACLLTLEAVTGGDGAVEALIRMGCEDYFFAWAEVYATGSHQLAHTESTVFSVAIDGRLRVRTGQLRTREAGPRRLFELELEVADRLLVERVGNHQIYQVVQERALDAVHRMGLEPYRWYAES